MRRGNREAARRSLTAFLRPPKVPRHAGFPRGEHRGSNEGRSRTRAGWGWGREAPSNTTVSLNSQRLPEKLPEVTGTSRGNPEFPEVTRERLGNILYAVLVEKAMVPHSSTLAWKLPWTEGPGRLQVLEKTLESPLDSKEIKPVNPKGNQF